MTALLLFFLLGLLFLSTTTAFSHKKNSAFFYRINTIHNALRRVAPSSSAPITKPGVDIPKEIADQNAIYDMILVERCSAPEQTSGGLFMPQVEGADKKHVGLVLSVPSSYGLESEQGRIQPIMVKESI